VEVLKYELMASVTISIHCEVEADSEEEAKEKAEELPMMSFCHQCANGLPTEEWVTSGELDGAPTDVVVE
jgi:hypothetical protein